MAEYAGFTIDTPIWRGSPKTEAYAIATAHWQHAHDKSGDKAITIKRRLYTRCTSSNLTDAHMDAIEARLIALLHKDIDVIWILKNKGEFPLDYNANSREQERWLYEKISEVNPY